LSLDVYQAGHIELQGFDGLWLAGRLDGKSSEKDSYCMHRISIVAQWRSGIELLTRVALGPESSH
jgi:hypothetical protein